MPVTLSGNARSQLEHPQSAEPTELSRSERGLNRDARSPWTCMEEKGPGLLFIHRSVVRSVGGPAPGMNSATTVAANFIFSSSFFFYSSVTLVLWNADAHEKYRQAYKKIQLPNVQGSGFTADVAPCLPRTRRKNSSHGTNG